MTNLEILFIKYKNSTKANILSRFFKTGKGQYGFGDKFLGITVPVTRKLIKKYQNLTLKEISYNLKNKYHEIRLASLLILVNKFNNSDPKDKEKIFNFYLLNTKHINNWDLVDLTTPKIVGVYLLNKNKNILYKLSKSKNLWERRIAVLSTLEFIKNNQLIETIKISEILLNDQEDLIHKAVGWMLREVGKRDKSILIDFLDKHSKKMPRTALRYAIEKFSQKQRSHYLKKDI